MKKFKVMIGRFLDSPIMVPFALLMVCVGGYGLLIPRIGYYGDDLSYAWLAYKSHEIRWFFEGNRPLLGEYYALLTQFLGPAPWHWQVVELLCRWASALAFWRLIRLVWPQQKIAAITAAALLALYPGFWLNSEALTFHLFFLQLTIFLLSLTATVLSLRSTSLTRRWTWTAAALAGASINIGISEYLFTLEFVRIALIWYELGRKSFDWRERILRSILFHVPFLLLIVGYIGLRLNGVGNYPVNYSLVLLTDLRADPWAALQGLVVRIVQDIWTFSIYSFGQVFTFPRLANRSLQVTVLILAAMLFVSLLWFAWMYRLEKPNRSYSLILAGLLCLLLAGGPIWAAGLQPLGDAGTSRFSLPFMTGACLLVVGLVGLIPQAWLRNAGYAVLTAGCLAYQLLLGFSFVQQKEAQKDFLWQLAERMPQLKQGTALITNLDLLTYNTDNSNGALVNWLYNPQHGKSQIDYYVVQDLDRIGEMIGEVKTSTSPHRRHRIGEFKMQSVVAISYHYPNCLRILDAELDMLNPYYPLVYLKAARMTDFSAVGPPAGDDERIPRPPVELFGKHALPDNWCSDYQKASRAAQTGDWKKVGEVGNHALTRGYQTQIPEELLVYIEGYARLGSWQRAGELIQRAVKIDKLYTPMLCMLKKRLLANTSDSDERTQALKILTCNADH